ncbi:MAG: DUF3568 family protein [Planctomycetes bacterium]|nr:DUF3568 family protein [Planctomycetota bacterium]
MPRSLIRIGLLTLLAAAFLGGCKGATASGNEFVIRADRKLAATLPGDISVVHPAARRVLEEDMLFEVTDDAVDAREGILRARTARNNTVRVETYRWGENSTHVLVFVGPFGDRDAQAEVYEALVNRVGY